MVTVIRGIEHLVIIALAPLLVFIGYRMFVLGATGNMQLTAKVDRWQGKLTNVSPGVLCFLLGVGLAAWVLAHPAPILFADSPNAATPPGRAAAIPDTRTGGPAAVESKPNSPGPAGPPSGGPAANAAVANTKVGNSQMASSRSADTKESPTSLWWYGSNSSTQLIPMSVKLRLAVSDLYFCHVAYDLIDPKKCETEFSAKFNRIPSQDDIATLEAFEKVLRENPNLDTQTKYAKATSVFLRKENR